MNESTLIEKLLKIEALFAGAAILEFLQYI
jgi:hypothetical protein